jgi:hypothetical protein
MKCSGSLVFFPNRLKLTFPRRFRHEICEKSRGVCPFGELNLSQVYVFLHLSNSLFCTSFYSKGMETQTRCLSRCPPQKGNSIMQLVLFSCSPMPWTGVTNGVNCNMTSGSIPFQEVLRCTIPENYLSPSTCAVFGVAMIPLWTRSLSPRSGRNFPRNACPSWASARLFLSGDDDLTCPSGRHHGTRGGGGPSWPSCWAPGAPPGGVHGPPGPGPLLRRGGILPFAANCFNMAVLMPFRQAFSTGP